MDRIKEIVRKSTERFGLILVECSVSANKIDAVIYRKGGNIGIEDLKNVTNDILERLSSIGFQNAYSVSLSSPGLDRVLKTKEELDIFKGKKVKISFMKEGKLITEQAVLEGLSDKKVALRKNEERIEIPFNKLIKVSLYDETLERGGSKK